LTSENQQIPIVLPNNIQLFIKREDTIHPTISGNKYRKLHYNLQEAKTQNKTTLLTFGGAFSNHIVAVSAAGLAYGFKTIGIIRGEELSDKINLNPSLQLAQQNGMQFQFVTREAYRNKEDLDFIQNLKDEFGDFYLLPEGGTNDLAIKGCEEILSNQDTNFTHICCSVGTGGTIAGIINSAKENQTVIGFSSLKGSFLKEDISNFAQNNNWILNADYHFGGYGKINDQLVRFINEFKAQHNIPLDPIYTGKMVFGVLDLIKNNYFPANSKILMIHTGGLQGIAGTNMNLSKKGKTLINI
jgi:1-aminocyclopropane-1-carboxylate deaminase